jgi:hypothetical protein
VKTTVTTTTTTEVALAPRVRARVRTELTQYTELQQQIAALEAKKDEIKASVQQIFKDADEEDALVDGVEVDGYKVKLVAGSSSRLDKKKLVTLGCKPEWITKATKTTPNKPYVRIDAPGGRRRDEEE